MSVWAWIVVAIMIALLTIGMLSDRVFAPLRRRRREAFIHGYKFPESLVEKLVVQLPS